MICGAQIRDRQRRPRCERGLTSRGSTVAIDRLSRDFILSAVGVPGLAVVFYGPASEPFGLG